MKLKKESLPYLNGDSYSNSYESVLDIDAEDLKIKNRLNVLRDLVKSKQIIHVGCIDHNIETIERKLKNNSWLHKIVDDSSERCYGIDIKQEEIDHIKAKLGFNESACVDILKDDISFLTNDKWDYMLLPEVLEHIGNPQQFLQELRERFKSAVNELVITVPNAFFIKNNYKAKQQIELVNTDHRFWFTPYTLAKLMTDAGFEITEILTVMSTKTRRKNFITKSRLKKYPLLRENLIIIAKFNS